MNKKDLAAFETQVLEALAEREKLGPYDVNAEPIRYLFRCVAILTKHLNKKPAAKNIKKRKKRL